MTVILLGDKCPRGPRVHQQRHMLDFKISKHHLISQRENYIMGSTIVSGKTVISSPTSESCNSIYRKCLKQTPDIYTKSQFAKSKCDNAEEPTLVISIKSVTYHFEYALLSADRNWPQYHISTEVDCNTTWRTTYFKNTLFFTRDHIVADTRL